MTTLDDPSLLELDASGMLRHISDTGPELVRAWERCEDLVLPAGAETATSVVLAGVGGSATAADYFAAICAPYAEIPVSVVRGYTLPNHVNDRTLVVEVHAGRWQLCSSSDFRGRCVEFGPGWHRLPEGLAGELSSLRPR